MSKTLIVGAGAVGCVIASYLQQQGESVCFLVRAESVDKLRQYAQLQLNDNVAESIHYSDSPELFDSLPENVSRVIVATKNSAMDSVIKSLAHLPQSVPIITTLNGVSHLHALREAFPDHDVTAATVMFNAQLVAPLHADLNTVAVIHMPASATADLFASAGFTVLPWDEAKFNGKLVFNVVNALGALSNTALNIALADRELAPCFIAAIVEAGRCVQAAGLPFEMVGSMSFEDYEVALNNPASTELSILPASGERPRPLRASMISDFENGRPTEIDQLNGEIVAIGKAIGQQTPINSRLVALVKQRSNREIGVLSAAELRAELNL